MCEELIFHYLSDFHFQTVELIEGPGCERRIGLFGGQYGTLVGDCVEFGDHRRILCVGAMGVIFPLLACAWMSAAGTADYI